MTTTNTKRAFFASVVSLVLCISMLVGSTFAWFTDTATTGVNTIKSGNLDVDLVNEAGVSVANGTLNFVDKDDNIYWEPGCTYTLENVYVENKGNLALKYQIKVTGIDGDAKLLEAIEWTMNGFDMDTEYSLEAGQKSSALSITGHMKETAGNEYKDLTLNGIAITVYATQYTSEHDSDNNTYDEDAEYNATVNKPDNLTATPITAEGLNSILTTALTGGSVEGVITVNLDKDFVLTDAWTTPSNGNYSGVNKVVINGNGHSISNLSAPLLSKAFGGVGYIEFNDLTIKDSTMTVAGASDEGVGAFINTADSTGSTTFNNCKLENVTMTNTNSDSYLGGFVGYSSAANLAFNECSVIDCTFNGGKDIGGFVGFTSAATTVTKPTITGTKITSTNASSYRIGLIAGTAQTGSNMAITSVTASDNTLTQGELTGTSVYYGRKYTTVTLDGNEI